MVATPEDTENSITMECLCRKANLHEQCEHSHERGHAVSWNAEY